jgi:hypothetical protein
MSTFFKFFGTIFAISLGFWFITLFFRTADNAVAAAPVRYEEYEEIYQTCQKISADLCVLQQIPDQDPSFANGFSKAQRQATLRMNLNRWVTDYNGKSRMITRSLWKSPSLPYQLTATALPCY